MPPKRPGIPYEIIFQADHLEVNGVRCVYLPQSVLEDILLRLRVLEIHAHTHVSE